MTRLRQLIVCALILVCAAATPAYAGPISADIWYEFGFDPNTAPFAAGCQPVDPLGVPCRAGIGVVNLDASPWTFSSLTPVLFTITDGFLAGDFFDVLDFGLLVGSTPPVAQGNSCGFDPVICMVAPQMSHASFLLPAGNHSISIVAYQAQILGEGFFRFTAVPEPSSVLLIALGLACISIRRRA